MKDHNKKVCKTNNHEAEKTPPKIVASIDDLLTEIYLRLPLKPLVRFKLVSKHWNSLISNPKLYDLRNRNPNPAVGLIFVGEKNIHNPHRPCNLVRPSYPYVVSLDESTSPPMRMLNFANPWTRGVKIMSSCNGLIVFVTSTDNSGIDHSLYHVCNPTTHKYFTLPEVERRVGGSRRIFWMVLAYEPSKSPHYKVVFVREFEGITPIALQDRKEYYKIEVYSSETGSLRTCGEPFTHKLHFEKGVYWNGAVFWITKSLYFNLDTEMLEVMPIPPTFGASVSSRYNYYLGESCGHLHFIDRYWTVRTQFEVYEMKRDYSEWFAMYRVDVSNICSHGAYNICTLVRGKENPDDSFLVLMIAGKFIRYNLIDKTSKTIFDMEVDEFDDLFPDYDVDPPLQYIESLADPSFR